MSGELLDVRPVPLSTIFQEVEGAWHSAVLALDEDFCSTVGLSLLSVDVDRIRAFEAVGGHLAERWKVVLLVVLLHVAIVARVFVAVRLNPLVVLTRIDEL